MRAVILSDMPRGGGSEANERLVPHGTSRGQLVIENPILNSPFHELHRHFRFDEPRTKKGFVDLNDQGMGFTIPYTIRSEERNYVPDIIVRLRNSPRPSRGEGSGGEGEINLIIEVTGEKKKDKEVKVAIAREMWIPAVNNHGGFGEWRFMEVTDPYNSSNSVRTLGQEATSG